MLTSPGINWYDRKGKRIKTYEEIEKKLGDFNYKVVKQTELANGLFVSTVWLGIDHNYSGGKPIIFETMVFKKIKNPKVFLGVKLNREEIDMERYHTEEEAKKGHELMCKKYE